MISSPHGRPRLLPRKSWSDERRATASWSMSDTGMLLRHLPVAEYSDFFNFSWSHSRWIEREDSCSIERCIMGGGCL